MKIARPASFGIMKEMRGKQSAQRLHYRALLTVGVVVSMLTACGSDTAERIPGKSSDLQAEVGSKVAHKEEHNVESKAESSNRNADTLCGHDAEFTLRIVYTLTNTFVREELRSLGAPAQAKGITRKELIIRDKARLVRRTGKTYMDDPEAIRHSDEEWENEIAGIKSNGEFMTRSAQWKFARSKISKVVLPIDWTDFRAPPGEYSYRYGLDPMTPLLGEKWREDDDDPWDFEEAREVLSEPGMLPLSPSIMEGVTVASASYAGHSCEMLRRQTDARLHETCYAIFDGHSVLLHGLDQSEKGSMSETAESVELGLCVTDGMLSPPGRVRMETIDG